MVQHSPSQSPSPQSTLCLPPMPQSWFRKPALACLSCRERKTACNPPQPGSKTCRQCVQRHLKCQYPLRCRQGMRKQQSLAPITGIQDSLVKPVWKCSTDEGCLCHALRNSTK
ncbi:hypothetical protein JVT61DRAFT_12104 [Boletus reticuloceps]|uniref:Zn(2)-C6 fungal-type domain-containing protein n=1 Tax=Boletus reticuloceps TaxID=495285 RepID=A0A8I3A4M9_9AGAM|nr:hypothetical protein JVT61DRAFT_12104 [Boletus reticuloceps]